jgi:hypothetical protein
LATAHFIIDPLAAGEKGRIRKRKNPSTLSIPNLTSGRDATAQPSEEQAVPKMNFIFLTRSSWGYREGEQERRRRGGDE